MSAFIARVRNAGPELTKFGTIGGVALVVNFIVSNAMWHVEPNKKVVGSVVGTVVATALTYVGNRFWTYKDRDSLGRGRELSLFMAVNLVGLVIESVLPVAIVADVLGFNGTLASNIAKYFFGVPVAMVFRLWTYRTWVFPKADPALAAAQYQYAVAEPIPTSQLPLAPRNTPRSGSGELLNLR